MTASSEQSGHQPGRVTIEGESFPSAPKHLEYLDVEVPEAGATVEVVPGIRWLRIPMPMDLNHINLWLLDDGDGWTVIDSGINADMAREAWERALAAVCSDKPLKRIFLTHLHPDHVGLSRWLQDRFATEVWMSARGYSILSMFAQPMSEADSAAAQDFMIRNGFANKELLAKFFTGRSFRSGISGVPDIARYPNDGDVLTLGRGEWQVFETDGHAEGHQCLFDAKRNILISGDQVLPTISSNVSYSPRGTDQNPLFSYLSSLERLAKLDHRTLVLPSHGRPFYGLSSRAKDLIDHHHVQLAAMTSACAEPKTAYELVPVLFKRRLIGSHWMFAMGETIAHAEYLTLGGRLQKATDEQGMIRYGAVAEA